MRAFVLLNLLKFVIPPLFALCGYLAFDFWNANRMARMGDGDGVTVGEYLSGLVSMAALAAESEDAPDLPGDLEAMMPRTPEGWAVQPTVPEDIAAYLPEGVDPELAAYVGAVVNPRDGNGVKQVRQTYSKGSQRVVVEMIRYPDFVFTSFAATGVKFELQMTSPKYRGQGFMTVRGMEMVEDVLPEEVGLRYFMGDVSSQIWVRVLATRTMTDEELLPFFQTLHVPAMNGNVVDKVAGMGEVPVIVLASAMEAEARAVWEAESAARASEEATKASEQAAERAAKEAEQAAKAEAKAQEKADKARGVTTDEETGVKIRKGEGDAKKKDKTKAGFGDDGCALVDGRKVCGAGGD
jgi:hypothetical protein